MTGAGDGSKLGLSQASCWQSKSAPAVARNAFGRAIVKSRQVRRRMYRVPAHLKRSSKSKRIKKSGRVFCDMQRAAAGAVLPAGRAVLAVCQSEVQLGLDCINTDGACAVRLP